MMRQDPGGALHGGTAPAVFPEASEDELRTLAWEHCGIIRSGEQWNRPLGAGPGGTVADHERRNIATVLDLIGACALNRKESRGAHYRIDYPEKNPAFQKHSLITNSCAEVRFV
jgi:L-aspartate oxidase